MQFNSGWLFCKGCVKIVVSDVIDDDGTQDDVV